MATHCIILCAGHTVRFGQAIRQLVPVEEGEPLLVQTIRTVKSLGVEDVWVVAANPAFQQVSAIYFRPEQCRCLAETLEGTFALWGTSRTAVLLGNVHYGQECLESLISGDHLFVGTESRVYGLSVQPEDYTRVRRAITEAAARFIQYRQQHQQGAGDLWWVYRCLHDLPVDEASPPGDDFEITTEATTAFETADDYQQWQAEQIEE